MIFAKIIFTTLYKELNTFYVDETDAGKLIRIHVNGIRIAGRNTQGVTLFKTEDSERVVSVIRLAQDNEIIGESDLSEENLDSVENGSKDEGEESEG